MVVRIIWHAFVRHSTLCILSQKVFRRLTGAHNNSTDFYNSEAPGAKPDKGVGQHSLHLYCGRSSHDSIMRNVLSSVR